MSRKRPHDANEDKARKKRKIHHDPFGASVTTRTKCEAVRQWAKDFEWATLDSVPVFGGKETNLFTFGRQIERMLELVNFPKDVLVLTAEARRYKTEIKFELEETIGEELKKIANRLAKPNEWWSPELVGKATNHCFESPVPDVFALLWRHTFPEQVREHRDGVTHDLSRFTHNNWIKFAILPDVTEKPIEYARTDPEWEEDEDETVESIFVECEHCIGNLVMRWCGMSRAVMRLVMQYYVFD